MVETDPRGSFAERLDRLVRVGQLIKEGDIYRMPSPTTAETEAQRLSWREFRDSYNREFISDREQRHDEFRGADISLSGYKITF